ncbi:cation:proton antiporter [Suilimivivens sp.]|uniref:cation:proton antiporter n=1 Tax=Suilimivivens sp. TaxID=2981669 RepID=UPI00307C2466
MLLSIALIMLAGMGLSLLCRKIKLPGLFGMVIAGILLGPYVLNLIDPSVLAISAQLRKIALIIILARAGLTLNISDLKKMGRPAILMCFLPATFEMIGTVLLAPKLLSISTMEAALLGAVIGAVSPAVIVPKMIRLIEEGYGTEKGIPQLILAGASADDVYVIVLFSTFTSLVQGGDVSVLRFVNIPVSVVLGILAGLLCGAFLAVMFMKWELTGTVKAIVFLCVCFLLSAAEDAISLPITFSSLIAVMFIGIAMQKKNGEDARILSGKFNELWKGAEVILFVLVGACVDISHLANAGASVLLLLAGALVFRMLGVWVCLLKTALSGREKLFCMLSYTPKATVQAAIGGIPLAMGLPCGDIILTVAVAAIMITAPLGAFAIDRTYQKFLTKN